MQGKQYRAPIFMWLLGIGFLLPAAAAEPPAVDEVLNVLGMDQQQIADLKQGQPVVYALSEDRDDEVAAGITWLLPAPLDKVAEQLRRTNPDPLDVDVSAYGSLDERKGKASLAAVVLPRDEAAALLDAEAGDAFNLSAAEIDSFKTLKRKSSKVSENAVLQHYREMLFRRFEAYRRGGTGAIAPYLREDSPETKPSLELRQAAKANPVVARYFPDIYKVWLDYPKPLPPGAAESFRWVQKIVEDRPAAILRHRIDIDWNGGILVLTREFYAPHSYNASQWITGCLPYRDGTLLFQQVRSYTDQVAGIASEVKHVIGRQILKDKILGSFKRFCRTVNHCP